MTTTSARASTDSQPPLRLIVLITVGLAIAFAFLTAPEFLFEGDSARYLAVAQSLVRGDGYTLFGQPERIYPPGFPLVLAPATLLSESFAAVARWAAIVGALAVPATYALARPGPAALPVALLTISSAGFLKLIIGNPRSEPIYMVFSLGLIAWAHHLASRPERSSRAASVAVGTALLLMSVATRSIGIAAVGAAGLVVLEWLVRPAIRAKRFPSELLLPLAAGAAFTLAWFAWAGKGADPTSDPNGALPYLQQLLLADPHQPDLGFVSPFLFAARIVGNLTIQASHAAELLTQIPWLKARWYSPFAVGVMAITVTGWWAAMGRPSRFGAWYFLCYAAILLLWPYDEGARFLVPVLPLLWLYCIDGARQAIAATSAGSRRLRLAVLAVASICLLGAAISFLVRPATFSRQDQAFTLGWILILGIAGFGWDRAAASVAAISKRSGKRVMIIAIAGYAAVGLTRIVPERLAQFRGGALADPVAESLNEASRWIIDSTPPGATIQASFPTQIQFATGRRTVRFPITSSAELLRHYGETYRPNFLVVLRSDVSGYYQPVDSVKFVIVQGLFPDTWFPAGRLSGSTIFASRSNPAVTRP